jgi:hypothetical protein
MPCLKAPRIPTPDLAISILLPDLGFSPPDLTASFCCTVETPPIPGFPIVLPLGAIPGIAVILGPLTTAIMTAIDELNSLLDEIPPLDCPFD